MSGVLVTGGGGEVGRLTLEALTSTGLDTVVSLDALPPSRPVAGVTHLTEDVRTVDLPALCRDHGIDRIVHLPGIGAPPPDMDTMTLRDVEVGGTLRVLAAAVQTDVHHVTVTSSAAAYGYHRDDRGRRVTEDDPVPGSMAFASSRHAAEIERLLARHRRVHPDLGQLVLRPATILGERTDSRLTPLFTRRVVLGLTGTELAFDFVWGGDVAAVIARGVTERTTGIYNLAGDGVVSLREIAAIEGRPYLPLPIELVVPGLRLLQRLGRTRYGPEHVDLLRYHPVLDNERLKAAFPGLPLRSSAAVYELHHAARS